MMIRIVTLAMKIFIFLLVACMPPDRKNILIQLMEEHPGYFEDIMRNAESYRVQIIYTQIARDEQNNPSFTTYTFRADEEEYFYPASVVKLPVAVLAMEKIAKTDIDSLTIYSTMLTDSAYSGQSAVTYDSSAGNRLPSIAHYMKKMFLVSDNDAFNRLYEFLGQEYINDALHEKGYKDVRITHRLSIPLTAEENRYTNPVRFFEGDQLMYRQVLTYNPEVIASPVPILLGDGYISGDSLVGDPMDFSGKNYLSLTDLHALLKAVIFPDYVDPSRRFEINQEDYRFLYRFMSMYPRESNDPFYGEKHEDNYCKFLMFADQSGKIPGNIRVFNKIGLAYGFLIETAYILDFNEKTEFILSAVISVNKNGIYNDGVYAYDDVGFPFMGNLGRVIYNYEKERKRKSEPDLSRFIIDYTQ